MCFWMPSTSPSAIILLVISAAYPRLIPRAPAMPSCVIPTGTLADSTGSELLKPPRYRSAISFFVSSGMFESTGTRL